MPEILQFHCPACGITLRIPMAAAGAEGPCPRCAQTICAPDPTRHLPPRRISSPGSIHAMMERINRTRVPEVSPAPAVSVNVPASQQQPAVVMPGAVHPEPTIVIPPPPPSETVIVKYPPFDPPAAVPAAPPEQIHHYPWHELGAVTSAPTPSVVATHPPRPDPPPTVPLIPRHRPEFPPARTIPIDSPPPEPVPASSVTTPAVLVPGIDRVSAPFSKPLAQIPAIQSAVPTVVPVAPSPQRAVVALSCCVTGLITLLGGFVAGYYAGNRYPYARFQPVPSSPATPAENPASSATAPKSTEPEIKPQTPASPPEKPVQAGDTPRVFHVPEKEPEHSLPAVASIPDPAPPTAASSPSYDIPAELDATIRGFLAAPSRAARSRFVLFPDRTRPKMENWYASHADEPFLPSTYDLDGQLKDRATGQSCVFFMVHNDRFPDGIPLIAAQTAEGWRVDWETFLDFYEDAFSSFSAGTPGDRGRFHLYIGPAAYTGKRFPGLEKLTSFTINPPMPGRIRDAFVATGSEAQKKLSALTDDGLPAAVVLELTLRDPGKGQPHYIEITGVSAIDWMPR